MWTLKPLKRFFIWSLVEISVSFEARRTKSYRSFPPVTYPVSYELLCACRAAREARAAREGFVLPPSIKSRLSFLPSDIPVLHTAVVKSLGVGILNFWQVCVTASCYLIARSFRPLSAFELKSLGLNLWLCRICTLVTGR